MDDKHKQSIEECLRIIESSLQVDHYEEESGRLYIDADHFPYVTATLGIETKPIELKIPSDEGIDAFARLLDKPWKSTVSAHIAKETPLFKQLVALYELNTFDRNRKVLLCNLIEVIKRRVNNAKQRYGLTENISADVELYIRYHSSISKFLNLLKDEAAEVLSKINDLWIKKEGTLLNIIRDFAILAPQSSYASMTGFSQAARVLCEKTTAIRLLQYDIDSNVEKKEKCSSIDELIEVAKLHLPENYVPLRRLGQGTVSKVYLAKNTRTNVDTALKIVKLAEADDAAKVAIKNIDRLRELQNPFIVTYYDPIDFEGQLIIPMKRFKETLADKLKDKHGAPQKIPFSETMKNFHSLWLCMGICHKEGITHPDLGPSNIGIDDAGVKVTDFNLAMYKEGGTRLGGTDYSSPNVLQHRNKEISPQDNLWSLGVILYEMLTGKKLFSPSNIDKTKIKEYREYMLQKQVEIQNIDALWALADTVDIQPQDARLYLEPGVELALKNMYNLHERKPIIDDAYIAGVRKSLFGYFKMCFMSETEGDSLVDWFHTGAMKVVEKTYPQEYAERFNRGSGEENG